MRKSDFVPIDDYRREGRFLEGSGYGIAIGYVAALPLWIWTSAENAKWLLPAFALVGAAQWFCLAKYIRKLTNARIELFRAGIHPTPELPDPDHGGRG